MSRVDDSRKLVVRYEELCDDPGQVFRRLAGKLNLPDFDYRGPEQYRLTRDADSPDRGAIEKALLRFPVE